MNIELQKKPKQSDSFLSSENLDHAYRIANLLSKTTMIPVNFKDKPYDILVSMEYGRALGLAPLQAIQNIAVINGKPTIYGDGLLSVCAGHPDFEDITEVEIKSEDGKTAGFKCVVKRKGRTPVERTFTIEDATTAGLWGRNNVWKQYPKRMLQMRARAFALRDCFADALGGIKVAEEVQDYEVKDVTPKKGKNAQVKKELFKLLDHPQAQSAKSDNGE